MLNYLINTNSTFMALYQIVPTGSFSDIKKKKKKLPKKMSFWPQVTTTKGQTERRMEPI